MTDLNYPSSFAPVSEEEMTYLSGGGTDDILFGIVTGGAALAVAIVPIGLILGVDKVNTDRLRSGYEAETGLSAVDETGAFTSDFENYKKRANMQGRNWLSGLSQGAIDTLATAFRIVVPLAALGAGIWFLSVTGSSGKSSS